MDVTLDDAVFLTHWVVSRSVAEVGRRWGDSMTGVLTTVARMRADGWDLPYRPLEGSPTAKSVKPVLASLRDDPACEAWVDGEGKTWTPAGKAGRLGRCRGCKKVVGPNGLNRLTRRAEPGRRFACAKCVKVVRVPVGGE